MKNAEIKNTRIQDKKNIIEQADSKQLEVVAKRILKKNKHAFEVLGQ
jgi:hypothetical protein